MAVVKVNYTTTKYLGEFLIIVWNLMLVFADDELTTFENEDIPFDVEYFTSNDDATIMDVANQDMVSAMLSSGDYDNLVLTRDRAKYYTVPTNETIKYV